MYVGYLAQTTPRYLCRNKMRADWSMSTLQNLDPDWTLERLLASKVWLNALLSSVSPKGVNVVPSYLVTDGDIQRGN